MAENNEITLEVAKRERPEDAEESTDEPRTKQAKVDLKAEEAEAAPVESKNTAASNGTDETKPEGTESAKDEAVSYPLTLLQADFCPFANRALIALLEKEADPENPTKF
jgi:hypothetical protein